MQFVRESIFISAIRMFCTAFAALIGVAVALGIVLVGISFFSGSSILPPENLEITIAADAEGKRDPLPQTVPVILRIDFQGTIGEKNLKIEDIEKVLYASRENFLQNRVKGILLYMNTPGGVANDDDGIYRLLLKYKEKYNVPIYAYVNGICASGGMYIAAAADKIYTTPESVVGSIGVMMGPAFNFAEAMAKVGVTSLTLTEGLDKDMLNPFRPWKPNEDASLKLIMDQLYNRFVDVMVTSRPQIDREKLIHEYGAHIFLASDALKIGYIDVADSDYSTTLSALVQAAGIPENTKYQVVSLTPPSSLVSALFDTQSSFFTGKMTHVFDFGSSLSTELSGKFLYLYAPGYVSK